MVDGTGLENQRVKAPQVRILSLPPEIMTQRRYRKIWIFPCLILAGFLSFVALRMATMDTEIARYFTYVAPTVDYRGIEYSPGFGQWSVALNGKVVAESSMDTEIKPIASTAKMIMALAVMEKKPFALGEAGETITITPELYNNYIWYNTNNGSTSKVALGEEISEYDALTSAMLPSSNNMADTLAIWAFGDIDSYREYATEMVRKLGASTITIGPDASGFNTKTTGTSEDLVILANTVLRQPVLAEIVGKASADVPVAGRIENTNKLLGVDGIIGVKTGYNGDESGYCLASGYKEGEEIVTMAVMGAPARQTSFTATQELMAKAREQIKTRELVREGEEVGYYESWWTGKVPIVATENVSGVAISNIKTEMNEDASALKLASEETEYMAKLIAEDFPKEPTFWERLWHVFGWEKQ